MDHSTRITGTCLLEVTIMMRGFVLTVIALCLVVSVAGHSTAATDPCQKARDLYEVGVASVDLADRKHAFEQALKMCPSYAQAHVNLADVYERLDDLINAEKHYKKAIDLGMDSPIPYIGLGEVYLKGGRFELAVEAFQKAIALAGDHSRSNVALQAALEREKREKAVFTADEIRKCLTQSEAFGRMCMCPSDGYAFLRKWICVPVVFFRPGSVRVSQEGQKQLYELATALNSEGLAERMLTIIGHADVRGDEARNQYLARQRALEVRRLLVTKHHVSPTRIKVESYGSQRPRADNGTAEGRAHNRRVEVIVD